MSYRESRTSRKHHFKFILLISFLLILTVPGAATAQYSFSSTHIDLGTSQLRDTRSFGMGGVGVSEINGSGMGFYNPASLAWNNMTTIKGAYYPYDPNIKFVDIGVSGQFGPDRERWEDGLRFGWTVSYWAEMWHGFEERSIYNPWGIGPISLIQQYYLTGSVAAGWKRGILELGLGGSIKFLEYTPGGKSGWLFDLGIIAAVPIEGSNGVLMNPRIGFSVKDLGNGLKWHDGRNLEYIKRYRIGAGFDFTAPRTRRINWKKARPVKTFSMSVSVDIAFDDAGDDNHLENSNRMAVGTEVTFYESLYLRIGRSKNIFFNRPSESYGVGLKWDNERFLVRFDYGSALFDGSGFTPNDLHSLTILFALM